MGNFEKMRHVRVARAAELVAVAFGGDFVGTANLPGVLRGAILAQLVEEFLHPRVQQALGALAVKVQRKIARTGHGDSVRLCVFGSELELRIESYMSFPAGKIRSEIDAYPPSPRFLREC